MKILFICNIPLNTSMGGVEAVIYSLIQALKKNKNHNYYFLQVNASKENKTLIIKQEESIKYFFLPHYNFIFSIFYTRKKIKSIIDNEKIEIINFIGSGPMLLKLPKKINVPIVITQHGIVEKELKYVSLINKPKFIFKTLIDKFYLPKFGYRIFISEYIKSMTREKCFYSIIPNPIYVNTSILEMVKSNRVQKRPEVIIVGNISKLKNQKLAILALNELLKFGYDFQIKIIGKIKDKSYFKKIKKMIKLNTNISSRVEIIDGLNRDETLLNMNKADILLVTSLHENLPMVIGEAMLLGKLVVAPDIGGIPEMISHNETGYIYKCNDLKSLCHTLSLALQKNLNNELIISNAKEFAFKNFDYDIVLSKTHEFFKIVLDEFKK